MRDNAQLAAPLSVGEKIAEALIERNMSQLELARLLAGPDATKSRVENARRLLIKWIQGRHVPGLTNQKRLCEALRKPDGYFAAPSETADVPELANSEGAVSPTRRMQRDLEDVQFVIRARGGDARAMDELIRRYTPFVQAKADSYFLAGGDGSDLAQEGLIGLYKAVRDFRLDKETSFRSFAELCVTRQIITAIKTATRFKHAPLNTYVSFSHRSGGHDGEAEGTLADALPAPSERDPLAVVVSTDELQSLVFGLATGLSTLETDALRLYLEGESFGEMAERLRCDVKTVDNALQRVKRKIIAHQRARDLLKPGEPSLETPEGSSEPDSRAAQRAVDRNTESAH